MFDVKIKYHNPNLEPIIGYDKGDWFDLRCAEPNGIHLKKGEFAMISLGISMVIPKEYEAHLAPRSSTYKKYKIIQTNSIGIIDNSYCGNNDIWRMPVLAMEDTFIPFNDRIAQFRFMPRMQYCDKKFKFGINFVQTDDLGTEDRGGFGSSGKNKFFG